MARILKLTGRPAERFGYKRAAPKKGRRKDLPGQMSLFGAEARIVSLPTNLSVFDEALLLHDRGDATAADKYREAIKKGENVADAWCNLGILESQDRRFEEALTCFSNSLQEDPSLFEAHYNLGNLHFEMDRMAAAKVHYQVARSINRVYPNLYFNLALALASDNDLSGAIEALTTYKELAPEDSSGRADDLLRNLQDTLAVGK